MPGQYRAKRTARNQPAKFDETLIPTWNAPAIVPSKTASNAVPAQGAGLRKVRLMLGLVWVAAATAAGIGVGLLIKQVNAPVAVSEPPAPVATAELNVIAAAAANTAPIGLAAPLASSDPTVRSSAAVTQAQAGSAFSTIAGSTAQPALSPNALQPGYTHSGLPQGNIGTSPAR